MDNCNDIKTPTKVEAPLRTDNIGPESKRDSTNYYAYSIGCMLYMASTATPDISFVVNQSARFTHDKRASHEINMKRICLVSPKDKGQRFGVKSIQENGGGSFCW